MKDNCDLLQTQDDFFSVRRFLLQPDQSRSPASNGSDLQSVGAGADHRRTVGMVPANPNRWALMQIMATTSLVVYLEGKSFAFAPPFFIEARMVKIVFELGDEWTVYDADDWRGALAVASNLLETQRELPERWRLRIEASSGPLAKWPAVN